MVRHNVWEEPEPKGYRRNHRGDLVRECNVTPTDRDMDATVRHIHFFGRALSAQMWRFREHSRDDIADLADRIITQYGGKPGGRKGNITLTSFDGRLRVQLAIAEEIEVGPEVVAAQALVEECVAEWSERANLKLRALVEQAFKPTAEGRIPATQLLRLRRVVIDDERWNSAKAAISEALRPVGKAEYVRLYHRASPEQPWKQLSLHLATVRKPDQVESSSPEGQLLARVRSAVSEARAAGLAQGVIRHTVNEACRLRERHPEKSELVNPKKKGGEDNERTTTRGEPSSPGAGEPSSPGAGEPSSPGAGEPSSPGAGEPSSPGAGEPST